MECSINSPALFLLMKHLVIGQRLKTSNFSAFHWSPHGSLVSTGQHFIATRVVYLQKSTETSLITESDQGGPNHQLLQLCMASTAWSDTDQAVQAVHSCNSWFDDVTDITMMSWLLWEKIYYVIGIGEWQSVYAMFTQFLMTLQTKILSTETSDFLKQIFFFLCLLILCSMQLSPSFTTQGHRRP